MTTINFFGLPKGCPMPLRNLVLVKRLEGDKESPGGITVPDDYVEPPYKARILAAGLGWYEHGMYIAMPPQITKGAVVFVNRHAGQEFLVETKVGPAQVSREKYILVRYDEIAGIFDTADVE